MQVTLPPAHLWFTVLDSHFNQEHKMFELQIVIERLTVLFDKSGSHRFKTKLGAKFISELDKTKCISSNRLFDFLSFIYTKLQSYPPRLFTCIALQMTSINGNLNNSM